MAMRKLTINGLKKKLVDFNLTYEELSTQEYTEMLFCDLKSLLITPSPSRVVAKISDNDPRAKKSETFPIQRKIEEIIDRKNAKDKNRNLKF